MRRIRGLFVEKDLEEGFCVQKDSGGFLCWEGSEDPAAAGLGKIMRALCLEEV